jgi:hypothetical protein
MSKKLSHEEVHYRPAISLLKRCSTCSMYVEKMPADCTLVERPIKGSDVCDRFEKRKKAKGG